MKYQFQNIKTMGQISYDLLEKVLYDDFSGDSAIRCIEIRAMDGSPIAYAFLDHLEERYESFLHVPHITDGEDHVLYAKLEGPFIDPAPYVQKRSIATVNSTDTVDAFFQADPGRKVEMTAVMDPIRLGSKAVTEGPIPMPQKPDRDVLEQENLLSGRYADSMRHFVNAARKGCSENYLRKLMAEARTARGGIECYRFALDGVRMALRQDDIDAALNRARTDWTMDAGLKAFVNDAAAEYRDMRGLYLEHAARLICCAYGIPASVLKGAAGRA